MVRRRNRLLRGLLYLTIVVTLATSGGCRMTGDCLFHWFFDTLFERPVVNEELNKTWREGGGFNNANVEKLKRGEEPDDF